MKKIVGCLTFLMVSSVVAVPEAGQAQEQIIGNCSLSGDTAATVEFSNDTGVVPIEIYGLDYECNRVSYATLNPGESYVQQTYVSHPWIAVSPSEDDKVLGQFISTGPDPVFISFQ